MPETDFSYSQVESPAPGAALAPGRHWLRGWVWPKPGGIFCDVRARVGDRIFPGIHGFPRADLATHFKIGRPVALAEFQIAIELDAGPVEVTLEALEIEGRWSPFQTVQYTADPAAARVDFAVPSGMIRWHEFGRAWETLSRRQRQRPDRPLVALAAEIVQTIPHPRDLRHPPAPFHGHLDEPAAVARSNFGRTPVLGYLFHEAQEIRRVYATFDLQTWQPVDHRTPSPNPAAFFPQYPNAATCALYGLIDVPAQLPNPVCLRLYAELADGSLHLCSVQRSRLITSEEEKSSYAATSPGAFDRSVQALNDALKDRGIPVADDEEMRREVSRLSQEFELRAPRATAEETSILPRAPDLTDAPVPKQILIVSHSLDLEGAPLFLVDYARYLISRGANLTLLSPLEGPLRQRFESIGAKVMVVDTGAFHPLPSAAAVRKSIQSLAFDFSPYDLVVCNTFTTFWAVHAAKLAGKRVLLYVHESTTPAYFYHNRALPEVIALVDEAFALADCVSFTTASTRAYHTDYGRPGNHRLTPGWIDVARLDAWRAQNSRDELRKRFSLQPDELLVTNIGTVSGRKGQHIFARAVDLLWQRHPHLAARTRFVMLGGRQSSFDTMLAQLLAQLNRPNLIVHPETADYLPYYCAADLFVCSSYEESSPRVILEAMACGVPILSSGVQGVPEMVSPDLEATLIPPGDTVALCEAMVKLLLSPAIGRSLASRARAKVVNQFEAGILLPRHAALAAEVAAGRIT